MAIHRRGRSGGAARGAPWRRVPGRLRVRLGVHLIHLIVTVAWATGFAALALLIYAPQVLRF